MKYLKLTILIILLTGCSAANKIASEEGFVITRKYVGELVDHRRIEGEGLLDSDIVWLKTSMEKSYGKIAIIMSGKLKLKKGDRLYIRRKHSSNPGMNQWIYILEANDGDVFYSLHSFRKNETVILPQEMFE